MKIGNFLYAFNNSEKDQVERIDTSHAGSDFEHVTIRGIELLTGSSFLAFTPFDSKTFIFCGQNPQYDSRFNPISDADVNKKVL